MEIEIITIKKGYDVVRLNFEIYQSLKTEKPMFIGSEKQVNKLCKLLDIDFE